jgi:hypothetical protein
MKKAFVLSCLATILATTPVKAQFTGKFELGPPGMRRQRSVHADL